MSSKFKEVHYIRHCVLFSLGNLRSGSRDGVRTIAGSRVRTRVGSGNRSGSRARV